MCISRVKYLKLEWLCLQTHLEFLCPCSLCAVYKPPWPPGPGKLKARALILARHLAAMSRMSIKVLTPVTTLPCLSLTGRMVICMLILHTTAPNQPAREWFSGPSLGLALQPTGSSWALLSTVFLGNSSRRWDKTQKPWGFVLMLVTLGFSIPFLFMLQNCTNEHVLCT